MKYLITIITLILTNQEKSFSQGNLQFNKVINLEYDKATLINGVYTIGTLNVPTDKVWKVESAGLSRLSQPGTRLMLNNFTLDVNESVPTSTYVINNCAFDPPSTAAVSTRWGYQQNGIVNFTKSNFPIWLSTGAYILKLQGTSSGQTIDEKSSLSIIEFNIVP